MTLTIATETPAFDGITRRKGLLTLLSGAMLLAGCGGGGGDGVAAVGGGGTGSLSVGPISGIGSIIVNGVRYEDSLAKVLDDDGVSRNRGELKLGMMVKVKGKAISRTANTASADCDEITFGSELLGPIESIQNAQTTAATLMVLGQTVQITANTIFEDDLTLTPLAVGNIAEVHGFVDPVTNVMSATRIERKDLAKVKAFKLQGKISDFVAPNFKLGGLAIAFNASTNLGNLTLIAGLLVRVRLESVLTAPGTTRRATKIRVVEAETEDRDEVEVEGIITALNPTSTAQFSVNGLPVNASGITVPAGLQVGNRVEVEGRLVNGVLVAKKVERKDNDKNEIREFELHGTVSAKNATSLILTSSGKIVVKVSFTSGVFVNGLTEAGLRDGVRIEVKGVALPDGSIKATRIKLD